VTIKLIFFYINVHITHYIIRYYILSKRQRGARWKEKDPPPSEEDREPAPLLIGTRLVRFVIRHHFIFLTTSPAAHFLSSQASRERRYLYIVHHIRFPLATSKMP